MKPFDAYLRVSRVGGRENLISPDEQERRARQLADERGLVVGKVITDLDESGGKWERPGLQEALDRVRQGISGGLIVAWLDRLSRDSEHAHRLVRELHEAGGAVYAPDAPADWTTPEGELHTGIVFAFAQYVRSRSRVGFERAKEQAIARGIPVAGCVPIGYRKRKDRRLEPDPDVAPIIREAFERRVAGASLGEISAFLRDSGVKTSKGSRVWIKSTVANVLANRVYLGEISYGERFINARAHEPIVDLPTWVAAQRTTRRVQPPRNGAFLLAGLLRCEACGYALQATSSKIHGRTYRRYRCRVRHGGGVCPAPAHAYAERVEIAAELAFWDRIDDAGVATESDAPDLAALQQRLAVAERRLARALLPDVQEAAGAEWVEMIRTRRTERDDAAADLGAARFVRPKRAETTTLRKLWPELSATERREILAAEFDCFVLGRRAQALVVVPPGSDIVLPRRGSFREGGPTLYPLDSPPNAWAVPLKGAHDRLRERIAT